MRYPAFALVPAFPACVLFCGAIAIGQAVKPEPEGFERFRFGATWAQVREQAIREYSLAPVNSTFDSWRQPKDKGKLYFSFRKVSVDGRPGGKDLVIDHYVVAGKEYEVEFVFDSSERFYAYRIVEIPSVDLKDYDTVVGQRLGRWKGIFEEKFGKPAAEARLPGAQALSGVLTPVITWKFQGHTASIMVFHRGRSYNVKAVVQDDKLAADAALKQ